MRKYLNKICAAGIDPPDKISWSFTCPFMVLKLKNYSIKWYLLFRTLLYHIPKQCTKKILQNCLYSFFVHTCFLHLAGRLKTSFELWIYLWIFNEKFIFSSISIPSFISILKFNNKAHYLCPGTELTLDPMYFNTEFRVFYWYN